jgi:hypothetical protein
VTNDAILRQLGYTVTKSALVQVQKAIDNTNSFDYVKKHLITLHDQLQSYLSYVALSSTHDYFKIKNMAQGKEMIEATNEAIFRWAKKYKVEIEKVYKKDTYYVLGRK